MKKVLSLVLAAAMALGVTATAFAAMDPAIKDTTPTTMSTNGTTGTTQIGNVVGTTGVSALVPATDMIIPAGDTRTFTYHVVAIANKFDAQGKPITYNHYNFTPYIKVKGPAEVTSDRIIRESFQWYTTADNTTPSDVNPDDNKIWLSFDVKFTLKATNTNATAYKDLVVTYGVTVKDVSNRSGLKPKTNAQNKDIVAGYNNEDIADVYDVVVLAFDTMRDYDEKNFDVALNSNPVIPSSAIRFLAKNLASGETATFVMNSSDMTSADNATAATYRDDTTTVTFNLAAIKALDNGKHINVANNRSTGKLDASILDENGVDYRGFNFVVPRENVTATFSVATGYNEPHVYLIDADGYIVEEIEVEDTEDYLYGDVVFSGPMTTYLITDGDISEYIEGDDEPGDEPIEDDDNGLVDEDGNQIENNPGTGSSNAISLAVAMAVVSLAAAGLVASKKASK